jgi:3-hydroxyisobutyrate dehydrogenase
MKVGFIGLGNLGKAIATRLRGQGVDLIVWNRTREKALDLGVPIAASPAELMTQSSIVFLNLFDSDAVNAVLQGKEGLLAGKCRGKVVIDTTTNHFEAVDSFYDMLAQRDAAYLEAPVLGSVIPASQGLLTVLVSGEQEPYNLALSYLEQIAKRIFYLKERTLATKMKLINNLVLGSFMTAIAESVALGEAVGVDRETVLEILGAGAGNSTVLNGKREKLLRSDFSPHFTVKAIHKDLGYLTDLAAMAQQQLIAGDAAREVFDRAMKEKLGDLDFAAVYQIYRR